jgi:hypothetical protein
MQGLDGGKSISTYAGVLAPLKKYFLRSMMEANWKTT